jgi:hypothetical protein
VIANVEQSSSGAKQTAIAAPGASRPSASNACVCGSSRHRPSESAAPERQRRRHGRDVGERGRVVPASGLGEGRLIATGIGSGRSTAALLNWLYFSGGCARHPLADLAGVGLRCYPVIPAKAGTYGWDRSRPSPGRQGNITSFCNKSCKIILDALLHVPSSGHAWGRRFCPGGLANALQLSP